MRKTVEEKVDHRNTYIEILPAALFAAVLDSKHVSNANHDELDTKTKQIILTHGMHSFQC